MPKYGLRKKRMSYKGSVKVCLRCVKINRFVFRFPTDYFFFLNCFLPYAQFFPIRFIDLAQINGRDENENCVLIVKCERNDFHRPFYQVRVVMLK